MFPSPSVSYIPLPAQSRGSYQLLGPYCVRLHMDQPRSQFPESNVSQLSEWISFTFALALGIPSACNTLPIALWEWECPLSFVFKTHHLSEAFLDPHSRSLSS